MASKIFNENESYAVACPWNRTALRQKGFKNRRKLSHTYSKQNRLFLKVGGKKNKNKKVWESEIVYKNFLITTILNPWYNIREYPWLLMIPLLYQHWPLETVRFAFAERYSRIVLLSLILQKCCLPSKRLNAAKSCPQFPNHHFHFLLKNKMVFSVEAKLSTFPKPCKSFCKHNCFGKGLEKFPKENST